MPASAASELVRQLERARVLHVARVASPGLAAQLDRLAAWQARRLNATYADLARQPSRQERVVAYEVPSGLARVAGPEAGSYQKWTFDLLFGC